MFSSRRRLFAKFSPADIHLCIYLRAKSRMEKQIRPRVTSFDGGGTHGKLRGGDIFSSNFYHASRNIHSSRGNFPGALAGPRATARRLTVRVCYYWRGRDKYCGRLAGTTREIRPRLCRWPATKGASRVTGCGGSGGSGSGTVVDFITLRTLSRCGI